MEQGMEGEMDGSQEDYVAPEHLGWWRPLLWTCINRLSDEGAKLLATAVAAGFALVATFGGTTIGTPDASLNVLKGLFFVTIRELTVLFSFSFGLLAYSILLPPLQPAQMKWVKRPLTDVLRLAAALGVVAGSLALLVTLRAFNNNFAAYVQTLPIDPAVRPC